MRQLSRSRATERAASICASVLLAQTAAAQVSASQTPVRRPLPPGMVTGHVTLEDTGGPARFAMVTLLPVVSQDAPTPNPANKESDQAAVTVSRVVHTMLDGSFVIPAVAPGNYYIMADAPAYLSASGVLTREQLNHPTKEIAQKIEHLLVPVAVASGKPSNSEVRLHRGASLGGTVRFDDGAPYSANVYLQRKDAKGDWKQFSAHLGGYGASADDQGRFHMVGLPAGSYRVCTDLALDEEFMSQRNGQTEGWMTHSLYTLKICSPNATREKDAKTYELTDGQEETGVQLEVPITKLHTISGSLVEKGSGRPINAGHVSVVFTDDGKELAATDISGDDDSFHLAFVPEGSYSLKVTKAEDVERTEIPNDPGTVPPFQTKEKLLRSFGTASQPLVVTTDAQGILIAVPPSGQADGTPTQPATEQAGAGATP